VGGKRSSGGKTVRHRIGSSCTRWYQRGCDGKVVTSSVLPAREEMRDSARLEGRGRIVSIEGSFVRRC